VNIAQYINSKEKLKEMDFMTVYQTILSLIGDGVLSMDDFEKVKSVER
jgi:hypothetical protein